MRTERPRTLQRVGVCLLFVAIAGLIAFRAQYVEHAQGGDHLILWRSAHTVLGGGNPYADDPNTYKRLVYPLPAVVLGLPFAWLSPEGAAVAFITLSAVLLGAAITGDGFSRVPIVFSICFFAAAQFAQTSILLLAFGLLPVLGGLLVYRGLSGHCCGYAALDIDTRTAAEKAED